MPIDPKLNDTVATEGIRLQSNSSFEEIVRSYQADVRILTRRHFGSLAEADEVAQEIFVQVYRGLSGFRGESSLRTWILSLARNQIRVHIRNESRRRRRSETVVPPEFLETKAVEDTDPFQTEEAEEKLKALSDCVARLGERQRSLLEAFYYQQQSAEMIASEFSRTAGSVRMLLMRIRKQLADCVRFSVKERSEEQT